MKGVRPADFPPPFSDAEAIGPPTDAPDERIDVGILIVGGGPGGLACAVRLGQLLEEQPDMQSRTRRWPSRSTAPDAVNGVGAMGKTPVSGLAAGEPMTRRLSLVDIARLISLD